ncbi:hypothetical protein [Amycolatopsis sp. NPDC049868]|uniref:hypothetical protein n=1 Tax=Amycolatopsis sp. NPDC049868 TaxID=3363934 RepID=UPI00378E39C4
MKDERCRTAVVDVSGDFPQEAAKRAKLLRLHRHVAGPEKDNAFLVARLCTQKAGPGSL